MSGGPRTAGVDALRRDFPALQQTVYGKPLVYLDNAATSQKPSSVIEATNRYYREQNANIHRAVHYLSELASALYEGARAKLAAWLGVDDPEPALHHHRPARRQAGRGTATVRSRRGLADGRHGVRGVVDPRSHVHGHSDGGPSSHHGAAPRHHQVEGPLELLGIEGNLVAGEGGEVAAHLHIIAAKSSGEVIGGGLVEAEVFGSCEIVLTEYVVEGVERHHSTVSGVDTLTFRET